MRGSQKNKDYKIKWSPEFAYAVGLITTDGCLSKDGRHLDFTSKDIQLIRTFRKCLGLDVKIGLKSSGFGKSKYPHVQFGNVRLYKYLQEIGLKPNKSKTLGELRIPDKFFFDFLRGHFDGDGTCYSYWDRRWPCSFMFYICFVSASLTHVLWLQKRIGKLTGVKGNIKSLRRVSGLEYAKTESKIVLSRMYYKKELPCLVRKKKKIDKILKVQAEVVELGRHATLRR